MLLAWVIALVSQNLFHGHPGSPNTLARLEAKRIASVAQVFLGDTGLMPARLQDLLVAPAGIKNWKGPYLQAAQLRDPWGNLFLLQTGPEVPDGWRVYSSGAAE